MLMTMRKILIKWMYKLEITVKNLIQRKIILMMMKRMGLNSMKIVDKEYRDLIALNASMSERQVLITAVTVMYAY